MINWHRSVPRKRKHSQINRYVVFITLPWNIITGFYRRAAADVQHYFPLANWWWISRQDYLTIEGQIIHLHVMYEYWKVGGNFKLDLSEKNILSKPAYRINDFRQLDRKPCVSKLPKLSLKLSFGFKIRVV